MNNKKDKIVKSLTLGIALATAGTWVNAATISYAGTTGEVTSIGSLTLQQFDSTLGTLMDIKIDWVSGFGARFVVAQTSLSDSGTASASNGFISSTIVNFDSPAGASAPNLLANAGTAFSASVPPTYQQVASGVDADSVNYGPLTSFIGLGTVSYIFVGSASDTSIASNGLLRGILDYRYRVNADVTYTYDTVSDTVVPVPTAVWLFGSGLIGLVGVARRKKV